MHCALIKHAPQTNQKARHLTKPCYISQEERQAYAARIVEARSRQNKLLHNALLLRVESRKQLLNEEGVPEDKINEEVAVGLLADLQEKQQTENTAMNKVLSDKVI